MAHHIVLHLTLTEGMVLEINGGGGWSCPCGSVYAALTSPKRHDADATDRAILGALALRMYRAVAEVETADLAQIFSITNHIDKDWRENAGVIAARSGQVRSTSVGDLAVDVKTSQVWLCAPTGWSLVQDPVTSDAARSAAGDLAISDDVVILNPI